MSDREIKSPIPGTFYRKPAPDQPAFKEVGDTVSKDDVIGLVEVMKTFHEIKAGADGTIAAFSVDDSEAVMAGQTLATLD